MKALTILSAILFLYILGALITYRYLKNFDNKQGLEMTEKEMMVIASIFPAFWSKFVWNFFVYVYKKIKAYFLWRRS